MHIWSVGWEDPLEEGMATHPVFLTGKFPWTEEPGALQSIALQSRKRLSTHALSDGKSIWLQCGRPRFDPWVGKIAWRRKWQPTPVFLPGKFMDRGAWQAAGHGVAKNWTRLNDFTFTFSTQHTEEIHIWETEGSEKELNIWGTGANANNGP